MFLRMSLGFLIRLSLSYFFPMVVEYQEFLSIQLFAQLLLRRSLLFAMFIIIFFKEMKRIPYQDFPE